MPTYVRGNSGSYLGLKLGAGTVTDFSSWVKEYELSWEARDSGDMTLSEAQAGLGVDWTLAVTSVISFDTGSFWRFLWVNNGSDVVITLGPGKTVATASAGNPNFTGTAKINGKPTVRQEADVDGARSEFEYEFKYSTDVLMVES